MFLLRNPPQISENPRVSADQFRPPRPSLSAGLDLQAVQEIYEKHKHQPPISRNMPPVTGSVLWARHLLDRIETPMKQFQVIPIQ